MANNATGRPKSKKKYITDYAYTLGATLLLNAVLQLIIYPVINKNLGAEIMGNIVFAMSVATIVGVGIGNALCQTRLVVRNKYEVSNTDFNRLLLLFAPIASVIGTFICARHFGAKDNIAIFFICALYILQYYGSVQFRLTLNYKQTFIYYAIISAGHLVGLLALMFRHEWVYIFIIGEAAGTAFILIKGNLYKEDGRTGNFSKIIKDVIPLIFSYVLLECLAYIDRIVLINILDAESVTLYYVVSLIGKTLMMLTGPINVLMISYISADNSTVIKKDFLKAFVIYVMVGAVLYLGCLIGTPVFTKLFYPELYPKLGGLNVIVNAGQVLNIVASLPMVLILSMLGTRRHMAINIIYAIVYIPLAIVMTNRWGMMGIAYASLISNAIRLIAVFFVGITGLPKDKSIKEGVEV